MQVKQWMCCQIDLTAQENYKDPLFEADITATFTHESGKTLVRPGFWMGGNKFAVRFAPTETGVWDYEIACTNRRDGGLNGITGKIECVPYDGELEIYKHGFLRVSENKRYFTYADGTPFYYLGDTHWLMPSEKWDSSNADGIDSQFRFLVDLRLTQGFTVYQSEPISPPGLDFSKGFNEDNVKIFNENLDKKFAYIAEKGLLHTNAQIVFAAELQRDFFTPEYVIRLAKMWTARYGAYPVMWTIAQEVDPDFYNHANVDKWMNVGETVYLNDCYHHPLTGHMCNENRCYANNTKWGNKYFHSWFGMQPQNMARACFKEFYDFPKTKPIVNYETGYEHLWNTDRGALNAGYRSFLNGCCGYGYGAHGIWNNNYSISSWMNYDGYLRWLDGALLPGATKLWHMNEFFKMFPWQSLVPHFEDKEYWNVPVNCCLATCNDTFMVFNFANPDTEVTLKKLEDKEYDLYYYDVNDGVLTLAQTVKPENGTLTLPEKPNGDFVQIITHEKFELPLSIRSADKRTLMRFKGDKISLFATKENVKWSVDDESIASIDQNGNVTAMGKNGLVTVTAEVNGEKTTRKLLCVRQNKTSEPEKCEKIEALVYNRGKYISEINAETTHFITVLPKFTPDNVWRQEPELRLLDANGNESHVMLKCRNYTIDPMCDGECYVQFVQDGVESEKVKLTVTGFGPQSILVDASVTCDDYHEHYDDRCLPQKAVNGNCKRFSGWCSEKKCSESDPAILTVTPKKPAEISKIVLYTTDQGYTLRSFDIEIEYEGKKTVVASIKDNEKFELAFDIEKQKIDKLRVICYKGDGNGNARIDEINAY